METSKRFYVYSMDAILINSENFRKNYLHGLILALSDKLNLKILKIS